MYTLLLIGYGNISKAVCNGISNTASIKEIFMKQKSTNGKVGVLFLNKISTKAG